MKGLNVRTCVRRHCPGVTTPSTSKRLPEAPHSPSSCTYPHSVTMSLPHSRIACPSTVYHTSSAPTEWTVVNYLNAIFKQAGTVWRTQAATPAAEVAECQLNARSRNRQYTLPRQVPVNTDHINNAAIKACKNDCTSPSLYSPNLYIRGPWEVWARPWPFYLISPNLQ